MASLPFAHRSVSPPFRARRSRVLGVAALCGSALLCAPGARAHAQTDYYNTDRGRPVQIEDAYTTERYAFELKLAPVRLERASAGVYRWGIEPEIAYGILPRTQIEIGAPVTYADLGGGAHRAGLAGLDLSAMHNLNTETRTLPALGLRADVLAPVGGLAPDRAYASVTAMATRTFGWARVHVNGQYTAGTAPTLATGAATPDARVASALEQSRWLAGVALDKTFPLHSVLLTGEAYARQPILSSRSLEWTVGTGVRYQWSPTLALDAGVGRRLTGDDRAWYVTFGSAYAFALAALIPGAAR